MSEDLRAMVRAIKASGAASLGAIAKALQSRGIKTPAGATTWHRAQVSRLLHDPGPPDEAVSLSHQPADNSSPAPALVCIVITANHVPLPVEPDDTVRPGWASADRVERVNIGRRLWVPPDLAELLEFRRQAARISSI
jgi:hypothetical protein